MSWLDKFFNVGIVTVQIAGTPMPAERAINFTSGVTATDDPTNGRTNLAVSGGGGGGSGYATIEGNGSAVTQRATVNFIGATVVDNAGATRTDVTIQGGPVVETTVSANTNLTRGAWVVQPVDTTGGPVSVTADATAQVGDIVQLPDAGGAYGTSAVTFNGNGYNVEDPYNQSAALASSWTSPVGFNRAKPGWMLIATKTATKVWRGMFAC